MKLSTAVTLVTLALVALMAYGIFSVAGLLPF